MKPRRGRGGRKEPRFALTQWNVHDRTIVGLPRTSNKVEGWHNAFSGSAKNHPHLLALITAIHTEQANTENNYVKLSTGVENHKRKKWQKLEERIVNVLKDYKKEKVESWLNNLALLVQF